MGKGNVSPPMMTRLCRVLRPTDHKCCKPSSIWSGWVVCSSICLLRRICPLNIFFLPFHKEDMKEWVSVGGGYRKKSGSSSSSIYFFEELSTGTSSGRTVGVQIECKHLLHAMVILSRDTNTRSYPENSSSGRKFLHKRVMRISRGYLAPLMCCEFAMSYCKMTVFKQTVCCQVTRLCIIWTTGLLNDVVWSGPKILCWIHRLTQWTF